MRIVTEKILCNIPKKLIIKGEEIPASKVEFFNNHNILPASFSLLEEDEFDKSRLKRSKLHLQNTVRQLIGFSTLTLDISPDNAAEFIETFEIPNRDMTVSIPDFELFARNPVEENLNYILLDSPTIRLMTGGKKLLTSSSLSILFLLHIYQNVIGGSIYNQSLDSLETFSLEIVGFAGKDSLVPVNEHTPEIIRLFPGIEDAFKFGRLLSKYGKFQITDLRPGYMYYSYFETISDDFSCNIYLGTIDSFIGYDGEANPFHYCPRRSSIHTYSLSTTGMGGRSISDMYEIFKNSRLIGSSEDEKLHVLLCVPVREIYNDYESSVVSKGEALDLQGYLSNPGNYGLDMLIKDIVSEGKYHSLLYIRSSRSRIKFLQSHQVFSTITEKPEIFGELLKTSCSSHLFTCLLNKSFDELLPEVRDLLFFIPECISEISDDAYVGVEKYFMSLCFSIFATHHFDQELWNKILQNLSHGNIEELSRRGSIIVIIFNFLSKTGLLRRSPEIAKLSESARQGDVIGAYMAVFCRVNKEELKSYFEQKENESNT